MNLDLFSKMHLKMLHCRFLEIQWLESGELMIVMRHNGALKWREESQETGERERGQGEGSWPQLQGNGPAVSLKNDNSPPNRSQPQLGLC